LLAADGSLTAAGILELNSHLADVVCRVVQFTVQVNSLGLEGRKAGIDEKLGGTLGIHGLAVVEHHVLLGFTKLRDHVSKQCVTVNTNLGSLVGESFAGPCLVRVAVTRLVEGAAIDLGGGPDLVVVVLCDGFVALLFFGRSLFPLEHLDNALQSVTVSHVNTEGVIGESHSVESLAAEVHELAVVLGLGVFRVRFCDCFLHDVDELVVGNNFLFILPEDS
jgi:hypothetical protein